MAAAALNWRPNVRRTKCQDIHFYGREGVSSVHRQAPRCGSIYCCSHGRATPTVGRSACVSSFIEVTPISSAADTVAALVRLLPRFATGAISPEDGQAVAGVIEFQGRAIETNDLAARIAALERGAGAHEPVNPARQTRTAGTPPPFAMPGTNRTARSGLSELQERAKREPRLQEYVDSLFALIDSITDLRPSNR